MKSIEVIVYGDGSIKIEAMGFRGPDCEKATTAFEQALGNPSGRRKKADYYAALTQKQQQKLGH